MTENKSPKPPANQQAVQPAKTGGAVSNRISAPRRVLKTRLVGQVDRPFLILVILLTCIGSVMIFSTGYAYAEIMGMERFSYARQQCNFVIMGMIIMYLVSKFGDYIFLKRLTGLMFFGAFMLNLATLIPGIGKEVNGARRWIDLRFVEFQPSEVLKFALILVCAKIAANAADNPNGLKGFKKGVVPFGILLGISVFPVLLQKHLSCTIILVAITFAMMWLGGTGMKWLGLFAGAGALGVWVILGTDLMAHSVARINVWRDPFAALQTGGWQPAQSLYAISAGGFFGLGLGQSNQKHGYLPEPHNDYIFSILCEELGYLGAIVVIGLFVAIVWRGFYIARRSIDRFASLMVTGIMCSLALHVLLNIAVVTNTLPSTGIGLPFFSYGGTSLMIWLAEMGVVLSVSRYSYLEKD